MNPIQSVLFLAFPNVGEQDLLVPWELFRAHAWAMSQQGQKLEIILGSFDDGPVPTHMGTTVQPERKISASDRFDVIFIPGGVGAGAQTKNETLLAFVRAHKEEGRWVAANCAGMGVLHRAGVLRGVQVTSSATLARRLAAQGTNVVNPRRAWKIIPEHKIFSAGGAGTVHPSSIAFAWHLFGDSAGRDLALGWDAAPLFGETLFSLDGPKMNDDESAKSKLQDAWEDVFLPSQLLNLRPSALSKPKQRRHHPIYALRPIIHIMYPCIPVSLYPCIPGLCLLIVRRALVGGELSFLQ